MNILDRLKEYRDEKESVAEYNEGYKEAVRLFERQRGSIKAIKDTIGFKEIVAFWERQKKAAEIRFDTAVQENKIDILARARYIEAQKFLTFLKNLLESSE